MRLYTHLEDEDIVAVVAFDYKQEQYSQFVGQYRYAVSPFVEACKNPEWSVVVRNASNRELVCRDRYNTLTYDRSSIPAIDEFVYGLKMQYCMPRTVIAVEW